MIGYYSSLHLGSKENGDNLYLRNELSCLSLAMVIWCIWLPHRAANNLFKISLLGPQVSERTGDYLLAFMFAIAGAMLVIPWLKRYREDILGFITIGGAATSIMAAFMFEDFVSSVIEDPYFYLGMFLLTLFVSFYVWSIYANSDTKKTVIGKIINRESRSKE